jgi:RND superfamily putative drug exporter
VVGQVGTTIGLGLLFDTLVVRAFMMPSVAAMLGRWFWWPLNVRSRPPRINPQPVSPQPVSPTVVPRSSENGHRLEPALHPSNRNGENG